MVTIAEVRDNPEIKSVWVLNTSHLVLEGENKGDVIVNLRTDRGEDVRLDIPNTWIPINLTEQAAKRDIMDSPQFLKMLRQRYIKLISDKEAQLILDEEGADAEQDKVIAKINQSVTPDMMNAEETMLAEASRSEIDEDDRVRPKIRELMIRDDIPDENRLSVLRNDLDVMTIDDCEHVLKNTTNAKITGLITDKLNKLKTK